MLHKGLRIEQFDQSIVGAEHSCGSTRIVTIDRVTGKRQNLDGLGTRPEVQNDFQTIYVGHKEVQHDQSRFSLFEVTQYFFPIAGFFDLVPLGLKNPASQTQI